MPTPPPPGVKPNKDVTWKLYHLNLIAALLAKEVNDIISIPNEETLDTYCHNDEAEAQV